MDSDLLSTRCNIQPRVNEGHEWEEMTPGKKVQIIKLSKQISEVEQYPFLDRYPSFLSG